MSDNQNTNKLFIVLAVMLIIIFMALIIIIFTSNSELKSMFAKKNNDDKIEEIEGIYHYWNCPFCKNYIKVKEDELQNESNDCWSYTCSNCNKINQINKKTNEVTISNW